MVYKCISNQSYASFFGTNKSEETGKKQRQTKVQETKFHMNKLKLITV